MSEGLAEALISNMEAHMYLSRLLNSRLTIYVASLSFA